MKVSRDPFAREEIHKSPIKGTCDFCGNANKFGKVSVYRIETDGGRIHVIKGKFCSKSCLKAYHG